jgi:type I restriction enzyme S subunit
MIDGLKPYPVYKDSGVPWLGEVPEHWELPRLGALLRERGETNDNGGVKDVLSVLRDRGVIPYADKGNIGNKKSEDITRYKIVRPDDIVVNCMNVIIGSVGLSHYTGCLSPVYYVLVRRSEKDDPQYLNAYFQTKPFQESLVRIGNGILAHRMRIPMELLKCEPFPHPPSGEQSAIVRFIDHVDRKIRRYIHAKQKLIKLLEEQKQAIIHRAVTRGLDPKVRLKPSGVEWLGDVPEHWEVRKLRQCVLIAGGMTPSMENPCFWNGTIPWVTPKDMKREAIGDSSIKLSEAAIRETSLRLVEPPAILMVVRGMILARRVPIAWTTAPVTVNQDMKALKPKQGVNAEFLARWLDSAQRAFVPLIDEAGHGTRRLPMERWRDLTVALPPEDEQSTIVRFLHETTNTLMKAIERPHREITLLREYRTRLIADVVTGKLDVREAAAKLPDEADETEPLDNAESSLDDDDEATEDTDLDATPEEAEA